MKTNNADKIVALTRHLEKVRNQMSTTTRTGNDLTEYLKWSGLELKRTQSKIESLKA